MKGLNATLLSAGLTVILAVAASPAVASPLKRLNLIGSGTATSTQTAVPTAACDDSHDCTTSWSSSVRGLHMGTGSFSASLAVLWSKGFSNGTNDGVCAPAQGTGTVTAADGATMTVNLVGSECETGTMSPSSPHAFNGTYFVTGGTARFSNATGSGSMVASDNGIAQSGSSAGTGALMLSIVGNFQR